ncbi:hypothetical protein NDU88_002942 [Pleurodeles waltl]|uniref:Uncharacterized protein n=1 Tax=Pleurodeles waltl TaxID=8319 RepID=A0AAV7NF67_PLEWA|nr:hypothetical protein NDU88_002942 [Pleurodeles waltl]
MGPLSASMTRFPVSRETLEDFRATEREKGKVRDQRGEGVEGENEDERSSGTEERSDETGEEAAEGGATDGEGPEQESRGASHDPEGSWLTKVRSILGTKEFKLKKTLGKGNGELGR